MEWFPLPIFPEGSLRESVVTTVWVGVIVISLLSLRFGWTYSGLVVPGYLVPLLILNPICATITVLEGIVAYSIVWFVSERMSRLGLWCGFFGRDRFFALLLSAVLVRVATDGYVLPTLANWLQSHWSVTLDYKDWFRSFGLVVSALIANQFWKSGLWRGLPPFFITTAITYFIVRYVLMTCTNFTVGHLAYMYSDVAASLVASPKSYLILLTAGFIASRMNLRYGLDYSGILIPALLGLLWYEPVRIVSTFLEAGVTLLISSMLLRTPLFSGITMEGPRKVLLFFNVAYFYRLCLGYILPIVAPGVSVNDYYGFAYLLSSLIAIKMHSKQIPIRLSRSIIQTALLAAVGANLLGLWLATVFGSLPLAATPAPTKTTVIKKIESSLVSSLMHLKVDMYRKTFPETFTPPAPVQINYFRTALDQIKRYLQTSDLQFLQSAQDILRSVGYTAEAVESKYLWIHSEKEDRGWGTYVINLTKPNGLLISIPAPLDEWGSMEAGLELFQSLNAGALAISGTKRFVNRDKSSDMLANPYTFFNEFHLVFGKGNTLQIRGNTKYPSQALPPHSRNALLVKMELPRDISLKTLEELIGSLEVIWAAGPQPNVQQKQARMGFAELWLHKESIQSLQVRLSARIAAVADRQVSQTNSLWAWLMDLKTFIPPTGSGLYKPPRPEELLYLDEEVLTPLAQTLNYKDLVRTNELLTLLHALNLYSHVLGYESRLIYDIHHQGWYVVLTEIEEIPEKRYWGTYVFKVGESNPYLIQVPRPLFEMNTLSFGILLMKELDAECLSIAGIHQEANPGRAADVLATESFPSLFNLVNQVLIREARAQPKLVVQCRGYLPNISSTNVPEIVLAPINGATSESYLSPLAQNLVKTLKEIGFEYKFIDGSPITAGYSIHYIPQALYLNQSINKDFIILWLSPFLRDAFRPQQDYPIMAQLKATGIDIKEEDLEKWILPQLSATTKTRLPPRMREQLLEYIATLDINILLNIKQTWEAFDFSAVFDVTSKQLFLVISHGKDALPALVNLRPRQPRQIEIPEDLPPQERFRLFLRARIPILEW